MTLIFESIKVKFCLISYKRSAKIIDGGEERQLAFKLQNLRFFEKRSKSNYMWEAYFLHWDCYVSSRLPSY